MSRTVEISIGSVKFTAHPLNLGEAEDLADAIEGFTAGTTRQKIGAARAILLTAWKRSKPDATDADVRAIEATPADLLGAVISIMRISGYVKDAAAGKAPAAPAKKRATA
jgi:hypothetical protein